MTNRLQWFLDRRRDRVWRQTETVAFYVRIIDDSHAHSMLREEEKMGYQVYFDTKEEAEQYQQTKP
jgi:tRNA G18 (ribose-2'-O)-methylase SpoU